MTAFVLISYFIMMYSCIVKHHEQLWIWRYTRRNVVVLLLLSFNNLFLDVLIQITSYVKVYS